MADKIQIGDLVSLNSKHGRSCINMFYPWPYDIISLPNPTIIYYSKNDLPMLYLGCVTASHVSKLAASETMDTHMFLHEGRKIYMHVPTDRLIENYLRKVGPSQTDTIK